MEIIFQNYLEGTYSNLGVRIADFLITSISGYFVLKFILTLNLGVMKEYSIIQKFFLIKTLVFVTVVQTSISMLLLPKTMVAVKIMYMVELLELDVIAYLFYTTYS